MASTNATGTVTQRQLDVMRLGPEVAAVKYSLPRKKWKNLVQQAHSQGTSINGLLSGLPGALRPSTQTAMNKTATTQASEAFAPAYASLNQQTTQAQAIKAKRDRDLEAWKSWLSTQDQQLMVTSQAADQKLRDQQSAIATQAAQEWQASRQASMQAVSSLPGNISDPNQATAFNFSNAQGHSADTIANARQQSEDLMNIGQSAIARNTQAHDLALAGMAGQAGTDLQKAMQEIASNRFTAQGQEAAAKLGYLQNLQSNEIQKASAVQQNDTASAALGQKQDTLNFNMKKWEQTYGLESSKQKLAEKMATANIQDKALQRQIQQGTLSVQQAKVMIADKRYKAAVKKDGVTAARDAYQRKHKLGPYSPKNSGGLTPSQSLNQAQKGNALKDKVTTAAGFIKSNKTYVDGNGEKQAAITVMPDGTHKLNQQVYNELTKKGYTDWQIQMAKDIAVNGTLSKNWVNKINQILKPYGVAWGS